LLSWESVGADGVGCGRAVLAVFHHWDAVVGLPRNRYVWMLVSFGVYAFGVGGMVFCLIRNPAPFGYGQQGPHLFSMHRYLGGGGGEGWGGSCGGAG
jgi:hypothetical protein